MGDLYLKAQQRGLQAWLRQEAGDQLEVGAERKIKMLAVVGMWGEASQRARALLRQHMPKQQVTETRKVVEVMVVLGAMYKLDSTRVEAAACACPIRWEPWVSAPMVLESTTHPFHP